MHAPTCRYNLPLSSKNDSAVSPAAETTGKEGERVLGCGTHTDCGFLTILYSDGEGLEVCTPQGAWIAAPCIPNALLVNLGDMAAKW